MLHSNSFVVLITQDSKERGGGAGGAGYHASRKNKMKY